ncbi:hypothetical protein LIA77_07499 [Sarocladium implicatum]|nr:hypothetical protein LIA77_07499 [Sarocladium implicatum]
MPHLGAKYRICRRGLCMRTLNVLVELLYHLGRDVCSTLSMTSTRPTRFLLCTSRRSTQCMALTVHGSSFNHNFS